VFSWFGLGRQGNLIREDRKHLKVRARRLLTSYLSADGPRKQRYYEVVAGAAAACQPAVSDPSLDNTKLSEDTAEKARNVVQMREKQQLDADHVQSLITDAYAVVAIAHRRAAAAYTEDDEMQRLGTAAVHLVTMATSSLEKNRTWKSR
jgi:hypothetical protein